jgi:PTS system fructose-specific IIA component
MSITENLKKENIHLESRAISRWDLINELIERAAENKEIGLTDRALIKKAVIEREKNMSTGIGNGVAIPHCLTAKVKKTVFMISLSKKGIDFNAIDSLPVKIVILLIVPKTKLSLHVKTLANIAKIMTSEILRNRLLEAANQDEVISIISSFEKEDK